MVVLGCQSWLYGKSKESEVYYYIVLLMANKQTGWAHSRLGVLSLKWPVKSIVTLAVLFQIILVP